MGDSVSFTIGRRGVLWATGFLAVGLSTIAACTTSDAPSIASTEGTACIGSQALTAASFVGSTLGPKQLALTFDDGPGSRTLELSAYLKAEGIRAAFFVNGHCFSSDKPCGNPGAPASAVFAQLVSDGHVIANHTQEHRDLTSASYFPDDANGDAALVNAVAETDALIAPYVEANRFLFRPPYGAWSARDHNVLQGSAMNKYYGPVLWDVGGSMTGGDATGYGADWNCWQNRNGYGVKTTSTCAARYLNEIRAVGRGIILLHDSDSGNMSNRDPNAGAGNTIDMVKVLVPMLKADGYTFVRLDEVPSIAALLPPLPPPPPPPPPPPLDAGPDGIAATPDATVDAGSKDGAPSPSEPSGSSGRVEPAEAKPAAPDPCTNARSTPHEHPYSADVH